MTPYQTLRLMLQPAGGRALNHNHAMRTTVSVLPATFCRDAQAPCMLGGRWLVQRGQRVAVLLTALHRNEDHWGGKWGSPHEFNPQRFMPGACGTSIACNTCPAIC